jgi:hypothetical protein
MEREAMRVFMGLYAARGGVRLLRAKLLRSQIRQMSTEAQEAAGAPVAGLLERRAASSWSASSDRSSPVTKQLGSPGYLQRALPERPAGETERQPPVAKYFIDTQAMVRALEEGGYSRQQAESVVSLLSSSLSANLEPLLASQVTRRDMELLAVQFAGEVESLRSSLVLLERSTIDALRNENEALAAQIKKLHEILKEEVRKVEGGIQLDLNLEKGRLKEETTALSQRIKDTHNRIETEVCSWQSHGLCVCVLMDVVCVCVGGAVEDAD